jgi:selT/selW/selH-like putative selenoprotein
LAAELKESFDVESTLFPEGKGIFDVLLDSKLIYSKYETQRFPEPNEVTGIINNRSAESTT